MKFFRNMLAYLWKQFAFQNNVDVKLKLEAWAQAPVVKYRDLFYEYCDKQNPDVLPAPVADQWFKEIVRPKLINPIFVSDYPAHMSPMAARHPHDPKTVQQWQFIVEGWEVVKCYTELTDPVLQRQLLEAQMHDRANGDDEA